MICAAIKVTPMSFLFFYPSISYSSSHSTRPIIMTHWASRRYLFICLLGAGLITSSQFSSSVFVMPALADDKDDPTTVSQFSDSQPTVSDVLLSSTQLGQWLQRFRPPRDGQPRSTSNGSSRDQRSCNATEPAMQA